VASRSATLLSPEPQDLGSIIQTPPRTRDRIVFFTDATSAKQCSLCAEAPGLAVEALQRAVVTLYGPESANQTSSFRLSPPLMTGKVCRAKPTVLAEDLFGADGSPCSWTRGQAGCQQLPGRSDLRKA
jgi:hypothetical protein